MIRANMIQHFHGKFDLPKVRAIKEGEEEEQANEVEGNGQRSFEVDLVNLREAGIEIPIIGAAEE